MYPELNPMRWPSEWQNPSALALLKGTSINCLLVEKSDALESVVAQAQESGIRVSDALSTPAGVTIVPGEWPGLKMSRSGSPDTVTAGATGNPWVDSNGWKIRLVSTLHPGSTVWLDAAPKEPRLSPGAYVLGVADAATYGARWIISLDAQLAAGIAAQKADALNTWSSVTRAAGFFAARQAWADYVPEAVAGVVSDFSGTNESLTHELLNLLARTNEQYRIILKTKVSASSFSGLKAVIYVDAAPPEWDLQQQILAFVERGGMLIAGPKWGQLPGAPARYDDHPHFASRLLGKGRVAVGKANPNDPYVLANDSVVLISHRHDLLRFWNVGVLGSYLTAAPDRGRAVVQMLFFVTGNSGPETASVRVAGRYRTAKLWTLDQPAPASLDVGLEKDAVELHLPPVSQYAAVELEV